MTTLSFQVEPIKIPEICSILMKYGIKDIKSKESLPKHILEDVKISLQESDRREVISSEEAHKQMRDYVRNCLDK